MQAHFTYSLAGFGWNCAAIASAAARDRKYQVCIAQVTPHTGPCGDAVSRVAQPASRWSLEAPALPGLHRPALTVWRALLVLLTQRSTGRAVPERFYTRVLVADHPWEAGEVQRLARELADGWSIGSMTPACQATGRSPTRLDPPPYSFASTAMASALLSLIRLIASPARC